MYYNHTNHALRLSNQASSALTARVGPPPLRLSCAKPRLMQASISRLPRLPTRLKATTSQKPWSRAELRRSLLGGSRVASAGPKPTERVRSQGVQDGLGVAEFVEVSIVVQLCSKNLILSPSPSKTCWY